MDEHAKVSFSIHCSGSPADGYGGLIPAWFMYSPLDRCSLGDFEQESYFEWIGWALLVRLRNVEKLAAGP
jgi:hypothetical protein